jgi:hypothetical protein
LQDVESWEGEDAIRDIIKVDDGYRRKSRRHKSRRHHSYESDEDDEDYE